MAQDPATLEDYADGAPESRSRPIDDRWYALPSIDTGFDQFVVEHAVEVWEPA